LFFALALLASVLPAAAASRDGFMIERNTGSLFDTTFDLGVDVSGVPHDPADAKAYLLELPATWQPRVLGACGHFLEQPTEAKSPETRAFCQNLHH
jgi:hypothetical protein